ncbi:MAG: HAD family phosphatase [Candidatus Aenigmatarchaeota archaeon]
MIRAIIFDMDGVISDTQKLHARVEERLLGKHGIRIKAKYITENFSGVPTRDFFQDLFKEHNITADVDSVIKEKWKEMAADAKSGVSAIHGAVELIDKLKIQGFKLGVASSSCRKYVDIVLSKLKVKEKFDVIVTMEDVKHGKPNPEIFLLAARKLRVLPKNCIVIEDGISGIIAAKKAGMKSIAFVKATAIRSKYPADMIVDDLKLLVTEKNQYF